MQQNLQAISDLELQKVVGLISFYCRSESGKTLCNRIMPFKNPVAAIRELKATDEYLQSLSAGASLPSTSFEPIDSELVLLGLKNSYLTGEGLLKIKIICELINSFISHFSAFNEYYPEVSRKLQKVYKNELIVTAIEKIVGVNAEIKDDASPELLDIRQNIRRIEASIDKNFLSELKKYQALGYLNEINESVLDHRRVLAVDAANRKKVKGSFLGTSKAGNIIFIEPESTHKLNRDQEDLKVLEKEELIKILKEITDLLRPYYDFLIACRKTLTELDLLQAKACYASEIKACLPNIVKEKTIKLSDAYHPLLLHSNNKEGKKTYPQSLELNKKQRIIVISGPNAGGKSISLKTIGLLQLMLQSGILVPCSQKSQMCFFNKIISDIGDKQSIENHLSTYSARLKNMADFLKQADDDTLFLIDEFGTGSDPELGGALAEVFLEELWQNGSFGILTTHYGNIKLRAEELEGVKNASMLFNEASLKPLYSLLIGQAGSSFTFEVAESSGIAKKLLERAKNKVSSSKITLEKTIAKLQREKNIAEKLSDSLKIAEQNAKKLSSELEINSDKLKNKLQNYQELYDYHTKKIQLGKKVSELAENHFLKKQNKEQIVSSFMKLISLENSKRKQQAELKKAEEFEKKTQKQRLEEIKAIKVIEKAIMIEKLRVEQTETNLEKDLEPIKKEKQEQKEQEKQDILKSNTPKNYIFKVGDKVRLKDSFSCGVIDKIEKQTAFIDYGRITTKAKISDLELVIAFKKR